MHEISGTTKKIRFLRVLPWRSVNEAGAKEETKLIRSQKSIRFRHSLSFTLTWCDYAEGDEGKETHSSLHWFGLAHDLTPSVSAGKFPSLIDLESDTRRQFKVPWENSQEARGDVIARGWRWKITENIVVGRRETFRLAVRDRNLNWIIRRQIWSKLKVFIFLSDE